MVLSVNPVRFHRPCGYTLPEDVLMTSPGQGKRWRDKINTVNASQPDMELEDVSLASRHLGGGVNLEVAVSLTLALTLEATSLVLYALHSKCSLAPTVQRANLGLHVAVRFLKSYYL